MIREGKTYLFSILKRKLLLWGKNENLKPSETLSKDIFCMCMRLGVHKMRGLGESLLAEKSYS